MILRATIPGRPKAKDRGRHGKSGHVFTPKATQVWESGAAMRLLNAASGHVFMGPCCIRVAAFWARPQKCPESVSEDVWATGEAVHRPSTPDADNVLKIAMDAGNRAKIWTDDAIVVEATCVKFYAAVGDEARVEIVVWDAE